MGFSVPTLYLSHPRSSSAELSLQRVVVNRYGHNPSNNGRRSLNSGPSYDLWDVTCPVGEWGCELFLRRPDFTVVMVSTL